MDERSVDGNGRPGNGTADSGHNGNGKIRRSASRGMARWNALRHGVLSEGAVLPTEDRSQFEELHKRLRADRKPLGALEELLVEKIATCFWRLRRILRYDFEFSQTQADCVPELVLGDFTLFSPADIAYAREFARLHSSPPMEAKAPAIVIDSKAIVTDSKRIDTLIRYETSIERQLYRAIDQLERLQRQRAGEYVPPPVKVGVSADV